MPLQARPQSLRCTHAVTGGPEKAVWACIAHLLQLSLRHLWCIGLLHEVWAQACLLHGLLQRASCLSHLGCIHYALGPGKSCKLFGRWGAQAAAHSRPAGRLGVLL